MFVLGDLPQVAWHGKEEGRSQMIGWDPKNGSGTFFPSAKKGKDKVSCWAGFVADGTKASTPGRRRQKKYLGHEGAKFFKPVLKIALSLLARKRGNILHRNSLKEKR